MYFKRLQHNVLVQMVSLPTCCRGTIHPLSFIFINGDDIFLCAGPQCWSLGADQAANQRSSTENRPAGCFFTHLQLTSVFCHMKNVLLLIFIYLYIYVHIYLSKIFLFVIF